MFGLFRARPPVDPREKAWIETRMAWLGGRLGWGRLREVEFALPNAEHFPLPFHEREDDGRAVFARVRERMELPAGDLAIEFFDDSGAEHESGEWGELRQGLGYSPETADRPARLLVERRLLLDLESFIAALAVGAAGHRLRRDDPEPWETMDRTERGELCELAPIWWGLGLFPANAVMRELSRSGGLSSSWAMWSAGAMTARYHGYALALAAWIRGEAKPAWRRHLRRDAEAALAAGLRYLHATGDAIVTPTHLTTAGRSAGQLADDLREGTPSRRVAVLWEVAAMDAGPEKSRLREAVASNLRHADAVVRCESAAALGASGPLSGGERDLLIAALSDRSSQVRRAAAWACGKAIPDAALAVPALLPLLGDRSLNVANAAAWALHHYGRSAAEAVPELIRLLRVGELHGQGVLVEEVFESLTTVCDDPQAAIVTHLAERDEQTCRRLLDALGAWRVHTGQPQR
jgi:hypothetical protein